MLRSKEEPGRQPGESDREYFGRREKDIAEHSSSIFYSKRYNDQEFEYR